MIQQCWICTAPGQDKLKRPIP